MVTLETLVPNVEALLSLNDMATDGYVITVANCRSENKIFKAAALLKGTPKGLGAATEERIIYDVVQLVSVEIKIDRSLARLLASGSIEHAYTHGPGYFRLI